VSGHHENDAMRTGAASSGIESTCIQIDAVIYSQVQRRNTV
jgi:hypothetical protein